MPEGSSGERDASSDAPFSRVWLETLIEQKLLTAPATPGGMPRLDRYLIAGVIGEGGMGVVLRARHAVSDAVVAIKIIKPEYAKDSHLSHRFLFEARHMARLSHDHILKIIDVWDRVVGPYYVMPYLQKGSLARLMHDGKPLDAATTLAVSRGIASALAYAHDKGLIHRDLKPDNILLDDNGKPLLADFGMVRTVYNDSMMDVRETHREGTPAYMSPAVAGGAAEDTRRDIYSFGATLYHMLTGRPPYSGVSNQDVLNQVLAGPPEPILKVNPAASVGLARIANGAMARELRDRYARMDDVAADLQRISEGKWPIHRPASETSPAKRHVWPAIAAAACIALMIIGGVAVLQHGNSAPKPVATPSTLPAATAPVATAEQPLSPEAIHQLPLERRFQFAPPVRYQAQERPFSCIEMVVADFTGDGNADLAVITEETVNILFGTGKGGFQAGWVSLPNRACPLAAVNLHNHGIADVVAVEAHRTGLNVDANTFKGRGWNTTHYDDSSVYECFVTADLNHDGKPDVAAISANGVVSVFINQGDGTFAPPVHYAVPNNGFHIEAADMDHDGNVDLVLAFRGQYKRGDPPQLGCAVMKGDGKGAFAQPVPILNKGVDLRSDVAIADLNGDGIPDLVVLGRVRVYVLLSDAKAAGGKPYGDQWYHVVELGSEAHVYTGLTIADMDGDGLPDLLLADAERRCIRILPGRGDGTFATPVVIPIPNWKAKLRPWGWRICAADLNHDGKPDLIFSDGADQSIGVLLNTGPDRKSAQSASPAK